MVNKICFTVEILINHSKPYKGSPIKANSLPLTVKKGSDVQFDPRPAKYRNSAKFVLSVALHTRPKFEA
jgi:hypothetical protein